MKYNWIEYNTSAIYITLKNKKTGKLKRKEYSAYDLWVYGHGPNTEITKVVAENEFDIMYAKVNEQFKRKLKDYFQCKYKNWDVVCISITMYYKVKQCREMSINQCLDIMTPEQFLNEFGSFPQIIKEG